MILEGRVKKGLGEASFWMRKVYDVFKLKTGMEPFLGTLNLELEKDYIINELPIIKAIEYGGTQDLMIKRAKLFNRQAFIIRTQSNNNGYGVHKLNLVEIISDINFRQEFSLKDDDIVYLEIDCSKEEIKCLLE